MQPGATHRRFRHSCPASHTPQSTPCPQPSPISLQNFADPTEHAVVGTQVGPPTHTCWSHVQSPMHTPQSMEPPHSSPICPQEVPPTGLPVTGTQGPPLSPSTAPPSGTGMVPPVPAVPEAPELPLLPL